MSKQRKQDRRQCKGELKRTSALIGKTGTLMKEIENEVQHILGTKSQ